MTRLSIDINNDLHQLLKIHTAHKNETIVDFVRNAIKMKLEKESMPNTKTLSAIKELENGGGRSFDSVESLMNNLND